METEATQDLQDWFLLDTLMPEILPAESFQDDDHPDYEEQQLTTTRPLNSAQQVNAWDPRLIIDLNLGLDPIAEILTRYGLTAEQLEALNNNALFRKDLNITAREMREGGITFTKKSAVQAEAYLEVLDNIVTDPRTPASTRLAGIKDVVRWGNLEPKESKQEGGAGGAQINVQINF